MGYIGHLNKAGMGLLSLLVKPPGSPSKTALPPASSISSVSKGKTSQRVSLKYSVCCRSPRPRQSWCNVLRKGYRPIEPDGGVRPSPFSKQLCRKCRTISQVNSTFSAVRSSREPLLATIGMGSIRCRQNEVSTLRLLMELSLLCAASYPSA